MYFVTFIDEGSCLVRAFLIKSKDEAVELLKRQDCWVERQSRCMVKKIMLVGGREYVKGSKDLEVQGIQSHPAALYTPQEKGKA